MSKQDTIISLLKEIDKNIDNVGSVGNASKVKVNTFKVSNECINDDGIWEGEQLIDTSKVVDMLSTFQNVTTLKKLNAGGWDTSNVTRAKWMFANCTNLERIDITGWDFANVNSWTEGVYGLFFNCPSLKEIKGIEDLKVPTYNIDYGDLFSSLKKIKTLNLSKWEIHPTSIKYMFSNCNELENLDVSNFVMDECTSITYTFYNTPSLTSVDITKWVGENITATIGFLNNSGIASLVGNRTDTEIINDSISVLDGLKVSIDIQSSKLDRASLRALINGLADLTGQTAQTLTLGTTLIAKLTEEDIAIATAKNWTIA
jgi:surface protein